MKPLCQWSEIQAHPGLILAMTLISNNPVAIMLMPDKIYYQEIKLPATKSKIQDMVATRHPGGSSGVVGSNSSFSSTATSYSNEKTTMIILCDDGSLKIYVATSEKTEYWLKPNLDSLNPIAQLKDLFSIKLKKSNEQLEVNANIINNLSSAPVQVNKTQNSQSSVFIHV